MNEITIEQIREVLGLIGLAVEAVDTAAKDIIENRHKTELARLVNPTQVENGARAIKNTREQYDVYVKALLAITGADTVDQAREVYLDLLTLYANYGEASEHLRRHALGFTVDFDAVQALTGVRNVVDGRASVADRLRTYAAALPITDVSAVEIPRVSLLR